MRAVRRFTDELLLSNRLLQGGFLLAGKVCSLSDLPLPVLYFVAERDDVARPRAVRAIRRAAPQLSELYEIAVPTGHVGLLVGRRAFEITWPSVVGWLRWREGAGPKPVQLFGQDRKAGLGQALSELSESIDLLRDAGSGVAHSVTRGVALATKGSLKLGENLRFHSARLAKLEAIAGSLAEPIAVGGAEIGGKKRGEPLALCRIRCPPVPAEDGLGEAVGGDQEAAEDLVAVDQRVPLDALVRGELTGLDAPGGDPAVAAAQFGQALGGGGHLEAADLEEAGLAVHVEGAELLHGVPGQLGHRLGGVRLEDQARGVRGGAPGGGQRALVDHGHLGPASRGDLVRESRSHDSRSDDDHSGSRHRRTSALLTGRADRVAVYATRFRLRNSMCLPHRWVSRVPGPRKTGR